MDLKEYGIYFDIDNQLKENLVALINGVKEDACNIDYLQAEVWGDINAARATGQLTEGQAQFLLNCFVRTTVGIKNSLQVMYSHSGDGKEEFCFMKNSIIKDEVNCSCCSRLIPENTEAIALISESGEIYRLHKECVKNIFTV